MLVPAVAKGLNPVSRFWRFLNGLLTRCGLGSWDSWLRSPSWIGDLVPCFLREVENAPIHVTTSKLPTRDGLESTAGDVHVRHRPAIPSHRGILGNPQRADICAVSYLPDSGLLYVDHRPNVGEAVYFFNKLPTPVGVAPAGVLVGLPIKDQDTLTDIVLDVVDEELRFTNRIAPTCVVIKSSKLTELACQFPLVIALRINC